jgi:octaheme c-type cytochrome (tetrathionate reductase family)
MMYRLRERKGGIALLALLALGLAACDGDDGSDGAPGAAGADGTPGADGISCWDLNENGIKDPEEDVNGDGVVDVFDCQSPTGDYTPAGLHKGYFSENDYTGGESCMKCHGEIGDAVLMTGHWNWEGVAAGIEGFESEIHGKNDIINNFCVAVPSNEGRCTQCHIGVGYADDTFDFGNRNNIDCLACHDQTGTYKKEPKTAGAPDPEKVDLNAVAGSVAENGGIPTRKACLFCHASAGGGDNVKHGDLSSDLIATTREYDVHMGTDGRVAYPCTECHNLKRGDNGEALDHGIGGMPYHSVDEGSLKTCTDCHGSAANIHAAAPVARVIESHPTLACQVCHIPQIARKLPTKTEWYWATAGDLDAEIPTDPVTLKPLYDPMKGNFAWGLNVRPSLLYSDGKWEKALIGANDVFPGATPENPAVLAKPTADHTTPGAMIYPFKRMIGNQPADAANDKILSPHLFGLKGGPNPYWAKYDWNLALQDGAAYTNQPYSGDYYFIDTEMFLSVNHEVAPKEMAYGNNLCDDCHLEGQIDWSLLGYSANPAQGGTRP